MDPLLVTVRLRLEPAQHLARVYFFAAHALRSPTAIWTARLPADTDWASTSISTTAAVDHVTIRIPLAELGPHQSVLLVDRHREAPLRGHLPSLQHVNNRFSCRACGAPVVTSGSFDRVLRLPSAQWQELAELWGCHTETFAAAPNRELVMERGTCYMGDYHVVVHAAHVVATAVRQDQRQRVRCAGCSVSLGVRRRDGSVLLHFDSITDERVLFASWTLERRLARQLFEISQGSGALRFQCGTLRMVLINWDTELAVLQDTAPAAILTVRYYVVGAGETDAEFDGVPVDWDEREAQGVYAALAANRARYIAPSVGAQLSQSFLWM